MPTLFCENGKHSWERESRRGRLPKNCPEHQPEKDIKITSGAISARNMDHAKFIFDESTKFILNEIEAATEKPTTRTLHCEAGQHDWQAPRQRGRAPRNCPEHAVSAQKPAQRESNTKTQGILLAAILEKPMAASCRCGLTAEMSPQELRNHSNCCDPLFVCSVLDSCRRAVGI